MTHEQETLERWKKADDELGDVLDTIDVTPSKLDAAIAYLRARGKYIIDNGCTFKPTPSTDRFSITKRYKQGGKK